VASPKMASKEYEPLISVYADFVRYINNFVVEFLLIIASSLKFKIINTPSLINEVFP
jgi:hypothetical protein